MVAHSGYLLGDTWLPWCSRSEDFWRSINSIDSARNAFISVSDWSGNDAFNSFGYSMLIKFVESRFPGLAALGS